MPKSSLYPWHYQIRWPLYFFFPSTWNRTRIRRRPLSHTFIPDAGETFRLFFIGDIMVMHHDVVPKIDPAIAELLKGADMLIGNCESPVLPRAPKPDVHYNFTFDMAEDFLRQILEQLGVPPQRIALSVANNHSGDQGKDALGVSVESFQRLGITPLGAWDASRPPVVHFESRGLRFGVITWTHWMNQEVFGDSPGVWRTAEIARFDFAEYKRREGLDLLIAFPHWEYEFQHFPMKETRALAKRLNENGVRLIVGSHPHVLQPLEWFDDGICAYSVGNFCGQGVSWPVKLIPILEVHLGLHGEHRGRIASYKIHRFVQLHSEGHQVSIAPFDRALPERRKRMLKRLRLLYEGVDAA
jgi:poly-gamma-glutamate capsule biosynthesis protein CapA/YwtB (metallophosphatase superfamily)